MFSGMRQRKRRSSARLNIWTPNNSCFDLQLRSVQTVQNRYVTYRIKLLKFALSAIFTHPTLHIITPTAHAWTDRQTDFHLPIRTAMLISNSNWIPDLETSSRNAFTHTRWNCILNPTLNLQLQRFYNLQNFRRESDVTTMFDCFIQAIDTTH